MTSPTHTLPRGATPLVGMVLASICAAQTTWTRIPVFQNRSQHGVAFDSHRNVTVIFGGSDRNSLLDDTWEFDGVALHHRIPSNRPPARNRSVMVFDSRRGRVVLFGGASPTGLLNDTWEWDGSDWMQVPQVHSPLARYWACMAYDTARGKSVLFGGNGSQGTMTDTWEYDGQAWTQIATTTSPPANILRTMSYEPVLGSCLLAGGFLNELWEFNGIDWILRQSGPNVPTAITTMVFDSATQTTLGLVAGTAQGATPAISETWTYDRSSWVRRTQAIDLSLRVGTPLVAAIHRGRIQVVGGFTQVPWPGHTSPAGGESSDIWEWNGSSWQEALPAQSPPGNNSTNSAAFAPSSAEVLLLGGAWSPDGRTYRLGAAGWNSIVTGTGPATRIQGQAATEWATGGVIYFGGYERSSVQLTNTTSRWTGNAWATVPTLTDPGPHADHTMVGIRHRNSVLMVGTLGDTWEFDGLDWHLRFAAGVAFPEGGLLAYDWHRQRVVMQKGNGQTWEWDDTNWQLRTSPVSPPPWNTFEMAMSYDPVRRRTVLCSGDSHGARATWEWDGTTWQQVQPVVQLFSSAPRLEYDASRRRLVAYGSVLLGSDLWTYDSLQGPDAQPYGTGCFGSNGTPSLDIAEMSYPWIGDTFQLEVQNLPANTAATLVFFGDTQSWNGSLLPQSLDSYGLTGCAMHIGPDAFTVAPVANGIGRTTIPIPSTTSLAGVAFGSQAFVPDTGVNAFGGIVSNALRLVAGSR